MCEYTFVFCSSADGYREVSLIAKFALFFVPLLLAFLKCFIDIRIYRLESRDIIYDRTGSIWVNFLIEIGHFLIYTNASDLFLV